MRANSDEYKNITSYIISKVKEHEATVVPVPNQVGLGSDPSLALCGCPNSRLLHPKYPKCTCNPENFKVPVCP